MTTHYQEEVQCAVCNTKSTFIGIGSTNEFGSPDLDTRPPEMMRSTIFAWVQRCPECGYCNSDISTAPSMAAALVHSPEYTLQLNDPTYPDLANSFLCMGLIEEKSGNYLAAAWSLIHASWSCDDADLSGPAKACRIKASHMIDTALDNGQQFSEQQGVETAIQVDLLRRSGRRTEAQQLISAKRAMITDDIISKILLFQDALLKNGDESSQTIDDALRFSD
ncbi:MAG: hypothetical protein R6U28_05785 [Cyclonatronaceae bacterium]